MADAHCSNMEQMCLSLKISEAEVMKSLEFIFKGWELNEIALLPVGIKQEDEKFQTASALLKIYINNVVMDLEENEIYNISIQKEGQETKVKSNVFTKEDFKEFFFHRLVGALNTTEAGDRKKKFGQLWMPFRSILHHKLV